MQVAAFQGHADSVMRAAWSPDGHMVATGSSDGVVCLWQPKEAALMSRYNLGHAGITQLARLEGHPEEVYAVVFLPGTNGGSGSLYDTGGGGAGLGGGTWGGQRLVTASGESLFLWDLPTQRLLQQAHPPPLPAALAGRQHEVPERWRPGYVFGLAAQPDGPLLAATCSDGRLRLWARESNDSAVTPQCTLLWNKAMGADCTFGPNGLFCAVSKDGSALVMDLRYGRGCLQHLLLDTPLLSCTLMLGGSSPSSPNSGQVLVAAGADGAVHFVDIGTGDEASLCPETAPSRPLLCATISSDGASLAASGESVVLGEDDHAGSSSSSSGSSMQPQKRPQQQQQQQQEQQQQKQPQPQQRLEQLGAGLAHKPLPKWSPISVWRLHSDSNFMYT